MRRTGRDLLRSCPSLLRPHCATGDHDVSGHCHERLASDRETAHVQRARSHVFGRTASSRIRRFTWWRPMEGMWCPTRSRMLGTSVSWRSTVASRAPEAMGATPRITPCASRSRRGVDWATGEARVKGRRHGSGADLRRPFTTTRSGSACALVTFLDEGVTVRAHPPLRPDRAGRGPAAPTPCRRVESLRGAQRRRLLCPPISRLLAHLPSPVLAACEAASDGLRGEGPSCTCSAAPPPAGGFTPRESRAARVPATPSELGVTGRAAEPGSVARELLLARLAARHLVPSLTRRACRRGRAAR